MNVLQFLDELPFRPDVEVVVAGLPERVFPSQRQPPRDSRIKTPAQGEAWTGNPIELAWATRPNRHDVPPPRERHDYV